MQAMTVQGLRPPWINGCATLPASKAKASIRSSRIPFNKNRAQFLDSPRVRLRSIDEHAAEFYASNPDSLTSSGRPIPTNAIWINAVALQHGLPIFSMVRHFKWVPGLILVE